MSFSDARCDRDCLLVVDGISWKECGGITECFGPGRCRKFWYWKLLVISKKVFFKKPNKGVVNKLLVFLSRTLLDLKGMNIAKGLSQKLPIMPV